MTYINDTASEFQIDHSEVHHTVTVSMMPTDSGTVEGTGQAEYFAYTRLIQIGTCESTLGPFEIHWPVTIIGRFTDDVLSFEVEPPSKRITVTPGGTCGDVPFEYEISHFIGWDDITFTDGLYEWRSDAPHVPPNVGNTHVELKLRRKEGIVAPGRPEPSGALLRAPGRPRLSGSGRAVKPNRE
jgi:hypothetical protein